MRLKTLFYQVPVEVQSFIFLNGSDTKFLILKNLNNESLFFVKVPPNIFFSVKKTNNFFFSSFDLNSLNLFLKIFSKQVNTLRFPFFIKLFLKGLGYRIKLIKGDNGLFIEFKLGFSHIITIKIESIDIAVTVKKNSLILSGFSKTEIGNLANRIYNLRSPNVYTGKGFRYKRVALHLKDVKKT